MSEQQPAQHHYPEIKRWLVGVGNAVVVECEQVAVGDGLVSDAQVAQLVGWREIPHRHHGKKADGAEDKDRHHGMAGEYVPFAAPQGRRSRRPGNR